MSFTHQRSPVTIFMQAAEYEIAASLRSSQWQEDAPAMT